MGVTWACVVCVLFKRKTSRLVPDNMEFNLPANQVNTQSHTSRLKQGKYMFDIFCPNAFATTTADKPGTPRFTPNC